MNHIGYLLYLILGFTGFVAVMFFTVGFWVIGAAVFIKYLFPGLL